MALCKLNKVIYLKLLEQNLHRIKIHYMVVVVVMMMMELFVYAKEEEFKENTDLSFQDLTIMLLFKGQCYHPLSYLLKNF